MTDIFSQEKRSEIISLIRSKNSKPATTQGLARYNKLPKISSPDIQNKSH